LRTTSLNIEDDPLNINDQAVNTDDFFVTIDDRLHRSQLTRPHCHVRPFQNRWSPPSIAGGWLDSHDDPLHRTSRSSPHGRRPAPSIAAARAVSLTTTAINISDGVDKRDCGCDMAMTEAIARRSRDLTVTPAQSTIDGGGHRSRDHVP
jgi:hypothetical protein